MLPLLPLITPVNIFTSVDFPAPFAPSKACISPANTSKFAFFNAKTGP
jgi:hypothetical protein